MTEITMTEYTELQLEVNQWFATMADLKRRIEDAKNKYPNMVCGVEAVLESVERTSYEVSKVQLSGHGVHMEHWRKY